MSKKYISTLEFYGYGESNRMEPVLGASYKVKVSDKDGNIITIEKDDSLYACVKLSFDNDTGVLSLLDVAHNNAVLADIEMPNADYIYNCRFDEELNAILFDVKSLYGNTTDTIELDVESIIELYEAGQGIEIGEKNEETGRKPISVKLVEGEELLKLSDEGLAIDEEKVVTIDELEEAVSGKADTDYVDELFSEISGVTSGLSGIVETVEEHTDEIEKIKEILGTDEDDPSIQEKLDNKADLAEFNDLEDEVGELEAAIGSFSGGIESINEKLSEIETKVDGYDSIIEGLEGEVSGLSEAVSSNTENIAELSDKIDAIEGEIDENKVTIEKITEDLPQNVREAYILKNTLGEQLGARIDIYHDSSLISIQFIPELQVLRYKFYEVDGTIRTVDVDLSSLVVESEFKDGLVVSDGKVSVKIDPTSDGYLTVSEDGIKLTGIYSFFTQLLDVNTQQWTAINNEIENRRNADLDLWNALDRETQERRRADADLTTSIGVEKEERENADNILSGKIETERERAIARENEIVSSITASIEAETLRAERAETALGEAIEREEARAKGKEDEIAGSLADEISARESADTAIRQDVNDKFNNLDTRVTGFENALADETRERQSADSRLLRGIREIAETYATIEYVNEKDLETLNAAVNSAVTSSKTYTDVEIDNLENTLKQYCDSGHTELQNEISKNATKINAISNLRGVIDDDTSNYDDSGNGILDVLHREFHEFVNEYDDISDQVSANTVNINILSGIVETKANADDVYTKGETDELLDAKLDKSEYQDISAQVSANTANIEALSGAVSGETERAIAAEDELRDMISGSTIEGFDELLIKLGYKDNDTLITTNEREVTFGQYNISNTGSEPSGQTIFSIGNGTDDEHRSNAIEIRKDGSVYMWVEGDFMNVNKLLGQIAHEIYDQDSSNMYDGD